MAALTLRQASALDDVKRSREHLRDARRGYHLALVIADDCGLTHEEIARTLDTKALYVGNAVRNHRLGKCGC